MRPETRENILIALLFILAVALFVAMGGDDEAALKAHAQWEQDLKDQGAWVMW